MRILALDTALGLCSACVLDSATGETLSAESLVMTKGHAESLLPLVERVIARLPGKFKTIERVAVSVGPGSFTGLRVALAAARAFGVALRVPVVGVTTLSAFALPYLFDGTQRAIVSVVDARHDHVYAQIMSHDGQIILPPDIISIVGLADHLRGKTMRLVGNAVTLLSTLLVDRGEDHIHAGDLPGPDIVAIAQLGLIATPHLAPPTPMYLKPPDALPQQNGRLPRA